MTVLYRAILPQEFQEHCPVVYANLVIYVGFDKISSLFSQSSFAASGTSNGLLIFINNTVSLLLLDQLSSNFRALKIAGLISQLSGSRPHISTMNMNWLCLSLPFTLFSGAHDIGRANDTESAEPTTSGKNIDNISVLFNILNHEQPSSRIQTISHQYVFLHVQQQQ